MTGENTEPELEPDIESRVAHDPTIPDDALLVELRRLADDLGRTPKMIDMKASGEYSASVYQSHFGKWNDALYAAGLEPTQPMNVSDDALLADLARLADDLGRRPVTRDVRERGQYSVTTYHRRFGSLVDPAKQAVAIAESDREYDQSYPRE